MCWSLVWTAVSPSSLPFSLASCCSSDLLIWLGCFQRRGGVGWGKGEGEGEARGRLGDIIEQQRRGSFKKKKEHETLSQPVVSTVSLKGDICIGHLSCVFSPGSLLPEKTPLCSHHPVSSWWWCCSLQTSYCKTPSCLWSCV